MVVVATAAPIVDAVKGRNVVAVIWRHSCGITLVSFSGMGMTLRPNDEQADALRRQAAAEGRSMQAVALSAIDEYIDRRTHKARVADALERVVREEAAVLERLKDA